MADSKEVSYQASKGGNGAPKILIYDIESFPNIAAIWAKYEQDALGDFIKERMIASFAWKWNGESKTQCLALPDFPGYAKNPDDNRALCEKLHAVLSEADIVVGHNSVAFDNPFANTDFIKHGFKPPRPYKSVDTCLIARNKFRFNSNKLDDLGKFLGVGRKVKHEGFALWAACMRGDMKAWARMKRYNIGDVDLLERVYLKLRPWTHAHPNLTDWDRLDGCPACRSKRLQSRGWSITSQGIRNQFQCQDCGKWMHGKVEQRSWRFRSIK